MRDEDQPRNKARRTRAKIPIAEPHGTLATIPTHEGEGPTHQHHDPCGAVHLRALESVFSGSSPMTVHSVSWLLAAPLGVSR